MPQRESPSQDGVAGVEPANAVCRQRNGLDWLTPKGGSMVALGSMSTRGRATLNDCRIRPQQVKPAAHVMPAISRRFLLCESGP